MRTSIALWLGLFVQTSLFAQTFNERMSDWPQDLRIEGTVMASAENEVTDKTLGFFMAAAEDDKAKIVSIHFGKTADTGVAADRWADAAENWHFHVASKGEVAQHETVGEDSNATPGLDEVLAEATGVCLSSRGQLTLSQKKWLRSRKSGLQQVTDRGGVVLGCGEVCRTFGKFEITGGQMFGNQKQASIDAAMSLIPDVVLQTRFDQEVARPRLLSVLGSHPRMIGVGLDSGTTLVLRGRKIRAIGDGQLHFFAMANERVPLRRKSISQPQSRRVNPYESLIDLTAWRRDAIDRTLEVFPPKQPEKPFVENGTLLIVGGGGLPDGMMDQFIELAGGKDAHLIYVPCTERGELGDRESRLVEMWKEKGVASADVVHTKNRNRADSDEDFLEPLKKATGIFFGGGRQWNFSDSYYGTEAHRLMKDVLNRGGVVAGSSAGASIQARYLARANPLGNIDIMAPGYERGGLGFISGVAIDQHFTQRGRQADMSSLVNRYPQLLGIGIDERTALVVQKSVAEVVGEGDVYFYDRNQQAAHDDPDYLKVAAGKKYDLAKREVVESSKRQLK